MFPTTERERGGGEEGLEVMSSGVLKRSRTTAKVVYLIIFLFYIISYSSTDGEEER